MTGPASPPPEDPDTTGLGATDHSAEAEPVERAGSGRSTHGSEEEIDEAGDESFPASDAPQWWSGEPADDDT